jgi:hypothetical protein
VSAEERRTQIKDMRRKKEARKRRAQTGHISSIQNVLTADFSIR